MEAMNNQHKIESGELKKSDSIGNIAKALSQVQGEIKSASKNSRGYGFEYADLFEITENIKEVAPKYALSYSQFPVSDGNRPGVITILMHESGEYLESVIYANLAKIAKGSEIQALGSTLTYLRRYALSAAFGMAQADDKLIEAREHFEKQAAIPAPNSSVNKFIEDIEKTKSEEELKAVFAGAWKATKDTNLRNQLKQAYDEKVREFNS